MRINFRRLFCLWSVCGLAVASAAAADRDDRLVEAAKKRDTVAIQALLKQQVDVNAPHPDGATALHWAAHWGDAEAVDLLLARRANVNAVNDYGATPLWVACADRQAMIVKKLLAAGADPNKGLLTGETVLMRCVWTGEPSAVEALLEHGADVRAKESSTGQTALMWAAAARHPDVTRVLLAHGAEVSPRTATGRILRGIGFSITDATEFRTGGFTPLLFAARHGDIGSAGLLVDAGAKVNDTAADGNTPLVLAAMSGHGQFASAMLDRGADPNASGAGYTALHAAVLWSDVGLVKSLLAKGANPNLQMKAGSPVPRQTYQFVLSAKDLGATPFALAAKYLEPELMQLLAAAGADPLVPMSNGTTPLMAAVGTGIRNQTTDRRDRLIAPELIAVEWENEARVLDTAKVALEAAKGSINQTNRTGDTALHGAAFHKYKTVVEFLVAQGGDLKVMNKAGVTPAELLAPAPTTESR